MKNEKQNAQSAKEMATAPKINTNGKKTATEKAAKAAEKPAIDYCTRVKYSAALSVSLVASPSMLFKGFCKKFGYKAAKFPEFWTYMVNRYTPKGEPEEIGRARITAIYQHGRIPSSYWMGQYFDAYTKRVANLGKIGKVLENEDTPAARAYLRRGITAKDFAEMIDAAIAKAE